MMSSSIIVLVCITILAIVAIVFFIAKKSPSTQAQQPGNNGMLVSAPLAASSITPAANSSNSSAPAVTATPLAASSITPSASSSNPPASAATAAVPPTSVNMTGSIQAAVPPGVSLQGIDGNGQPTTIAVSGQNTVPLDQKVIWQSYSIGSSLAATMTGGGKTFAQNGPSSGIFSSSGGWNTGYTQIIVTGMQMMQPLSGGTVSMTLAPVKMTPVLSGGMVSSTLAIQQHS